MSALRSRVTRSGLAVALGLAILLAFYTWTAFTTAEGFPHQMAVDGRSYFALQAEAFLDGRASLPVQPAPGLLALADPYDPAANVFFRVHDLALFEKRYYLYWEPAPVLTLFLPARLLTGRDLPERLAVVIYCFAGLLFSLLLLRYLVRRHLPGTPGWMLGLAGVALATSNVGLFLLRRATVYEVSISAGFCFLMAAIYLLVTGGFEERLRWRRLIGGGLCLALAVGARPNLGVAALLALAILARAWRGAELATWRRRAGAVAALLGPMALAGVLVLAYNKFRFDSFTEFGLAYQLNQIEDPFPPGGFGHSLLGLYYYGVAPPLLDLNFPFFHLPPPPGFPGTTPAGYSLEPTGGLVGTVPIVLALLAGLPLAWRRSAGGRPGRELALVMLLLCAMAGILLLFLSVALYGVAGRYAMDFTSLLLIAALVAWILVVRSARPGRLRQALAAGGAVLIAWGAAAGVALSFTGATDGLRAGRPGTYASLERAASPLPAAATAIAGGPTITEVRSPSGVAAEVAYGRADRAPATVNVGRQPATVEITAPGRREVVLRGTVRAFGGAWIPAARLSLELPGEPRALRSPLVRDLEVPLRLRRGLNPVTLQVPGALPPKAGETIDTPVVSIRGLRLVDAPRSAR